MSDWWWGLKREMQPILKNLRVGIYASGGAPFHHASLIALWGGKPVMLDAASIGEGGLAAVDVLVVPGGGLRAMEGLLQPLGIEGAANIRHWVAEGGMYVGSCAGSFLPACLGHGYWSAHPEARELYMVPACLANSGESELEGLVSPGVGTVEVAIAKPNHWLAEGLPSRFELVHYNGPMFLLEPTQDAFPLDKVTQPPIGVARYVRCCAEFTPSEGFLATNSPPATVFEACVRRGACAAIASGYGLGTVVLFGAHPEFGFDVLQLGWGKGVRLFANALRHQARNRGLTRINDAVAVTPVPTPTTTSTATTLDQIANQLLELSHRYSVLQRTIPEAWLVPGQAPCFMGRTAQQLWSEGLNRAAGVSRDTARYLRAMILSRNEDALSEGASWIDHEGMPGQDFGFIGLRQLVERIQQFVDKGEVNLSASPFAMQHAYDGFLDHPFHLLVGSYLSAVGLTAAAALSSSVIGSLVNFTDVPPVGPS